MKELIKELWLCADAYEEPPYGLEVEGTVDLLRDAAAQLANYENVHRKIIKRIEEIKATSYYPNFTGQMVEDLEWILNQLN